MMEDESLGYHLKAGNTVSLRKRIDLLKQNQS